MLEFLEFSDSVLTYYSNSLYMSYGFLVKKSSFQEPVEPWPNLGVQIPPVEAIFVENTTPA